MPRWPGHVPELDGAATDGTELVIAPDKASGHLSGAFNALCPVMTGDKLVHCTCFHLLRATVVSPFSIKEGPRHTEKGSDLLD